MHGIIKHGIIKPLSMQTQGLKVLSAKVKMLEHASNIVKRYLSDQQNNSSKLRNPLFLHHVLQSAQGRQLGSCHLFFSFETGMWLFPTCRQGKHLQCKGMGAAPLTLAVPQL